MKFLLVKIRQEKLENFTFNCCHRYTCILKTTVFFYMKRPIIVSIAGYGNVTKRCIHSDTTSSALQSMLHSLSLCRVMSYIFVLYYVMLFLSLASRSDNFIVGLTNINPNISRPRLWNYTLCGQYPGAVPAGATVYLYCQDNLPPFRYVIVQFPTTDSMNFCEIEVFVVGMKIFWIRVMNALVFTDCCTVSEQSCFLGRRL